MKEINALNMAQDLCNGAKDLIESMDLTAREISPNVATFEMCTCEHDTGKRRDGNFKSGARHRFQVIVIALPVEPE